MIAIFFFFLLFFSLDCKHNKVKFFTMFLLSFLFRKSKYHPIQWGATPKFGFVGLTD